MSVASSFEDFDLVGDAFGVAVGLGVVEVVEDESGPGGECACDVGEFWDVGLGDVVGPELGSSGGFGPVWCLVDVGEGFFEPVGDSDFGLEFEELLESLGFVGCEPVVSSHIEPSAPPDVGDESGVVLSGQTSVTADDGDLAAMSDPDSLGGVVNGADYVELVDHDPCMGQDFLDGLTVGPEHVDHDGLDPISPRFRQPV